MAKTYLFVCGCPRSGTTALAHILNWNADVVMGIERYSALLRDRQSDFVPELFQLPRFDTFEKGDCGYSSFATFPEYAVPHAKAFDPTRIDSAGFVGDKIPELYRQFGAFSTAKWADRQVAIIQITRNVIDVARSYETRRLDPNGGWTGGYSDAVREWSFAMDCGLRMQSAPPPHVRFVVTRYEDLFERGEEAFLSECDGLARSLGLLPESTDRTGLTRVFADSRARSARRKKNDVVAEEVVLKDVPRHSLDAYQALANQATLQQSS